MKRPLIAVAAAALVLAGCSDDDPIRSGSMGSADDPTPSEPSAAAEPVDPAGPAARGSRDRGERAARGLALPRGRRPWRRCAALRPGTRLVARHRHARCHRDTDLPVDRDRRVVPARLQRGARDREPHRRRCRRRVRAARQGPGDPVAGARGPALRAWSSTTPGRPNPSTYPRSGRTSARPASRSPTTTRCGRCRSRGAPTRGTPSTTTPPTRRCTTSRCPSRLRGWGSRTATSSRREEQDGLTVTRWHLAEPAASYLIDAGVRRLRADRAQRPARHPDPDLHASRHTGGGRGAVDRAAGDGVARAVHRAVPVRHVRHPRRRLAERHGDPDHGDARQQRLRAVRAGRGARARAPVVRRHRHARRLARRLDERGHGDVPPGHVGGRAGRHHDRPADGRAGRSSRTASASSPGRPPTTTSTSGAAATSTTARP